MISAVIVSYRTGALAVRAIESLRRDAERSHLPSEIICVVNSQDPTEIEQVTHAADLVVMPGRNLGYGGGLNAGVEKARGDLLVFANPDILVLEGALASMASAIEETPLRMAGPGLFWDEEQRFLIPPADEPSPVEMLRRTIAVSRPENGLLFRRDLKRALAQRRAILEGKTFRVRALSGAFMAVDRRTWQMVGPFDEGFRLYYEENDWQSRLRALKGDLVLAGGARVIHKFNQSARKEPRAGSWFAASEERFFRIHHGERGLETLQAARRYPPRALPALPPFTQIEIPKGAAWGVAVSPARYFRPFAFCVPGPGPFRLPSDLTDSISGETWFLRAVNLDSFVIEDESHVATPDASSSGVP